MNLVKTFQHSLGKRDDRNDDFVLVRTLLNSRVLGILGDFTSDSPAGINHRLENELAHFIDDRIESWRKALVDPRRIVGMVTRHINEWLAQRREKARTTLIVVLYDAFEGCFHYISIGDSVLALAGPGRLIFLSKGDTSGSRDASGFLPLESDHLVIQQARTQPGFTLFACTDGIWENTGHLEEMKPDRCESFLAETFVGPDRDLIAENLRKGLINRCSRVDDLSILFFKEETMVDNSKPGGELPPDLMDAVDKRIFEAIERNMKSRPNTASPMEQEFLALLRQTNEGIRNLESRIDQKIDSRTGDSHQMRQMTADYGTLQDQLSQMNDKISRLNDRFAVLTDQVAEHGSRLGGLEGSQRRQSRTSIPDPVPESRIAPSLPKKTTDEKQPLDRPRKPEKKAANTKSQESKPPMVTPDYQPQGGLVGPQRDDTPKPTLEDDSTRVPVPASIPLQTDPAVKHNPHPTPAVRGKTPHSFVDPVGEHPHHHEDHAQGQPPAGLPIWKLLAGIAFLVFALWAGYRLTTKNRTLLEDVEAQKAASRILEGLNTCPEGSLEQQLASHRPAPDTTGYFKDIKTPAALLAILSMDDWTFRTELVNLENRLAANLDLIKNHPDKTFAVNMADQPIRRQGSFELTVRYANQVPWLKNLVATKGNRISAETVYYIWLQIATNAKDKDGLWGEGTQKAVTEFINDVGTVNLGKDALGLNGPDGLARLMRENRELSPLDQGFEFSVVQAFDIDGTVYEEQLRALAQAVNKGRYNLATSFLRLDQTLGGQGFGIYVEFCSNGSPTPIETWNRSFLPATGSLSPNTAPEVALIPDRGIFNLWLAARLGLVSSGGDSDSVLKILSLLEGKSATDVAAACKQ